MKIVTFLLFLTSYSSAQTITYKGKVIQSLDSRPIEGAFISIKRNSQELSSHVSNKNGAFEFVVDIEAYPITEVSILISHISFQDKRIYLSNISNGFVVSLIPSVEQLDEVLVKNKVRDSAAFKQNNNREIVSLVKLQSIPSYDVYDGVASMKEVDISSQSMTFKSINTRGFNSTGNIRFGQFVDGMDIQAPGFNFPLGAFSLPHQIDIENMEVIPGVSNVDYGPNAFNGVLLVKTKSPMEFQGLDVNIKTGFNRLTEGGGGKSLFDVGGDLTYDVALRFADSWFNRSLGFKTVVSYMQAKDWRANDYSNIGLGEHYETDNSNPGYNGINVYGDEISTLLPVGEGNQLIQVNRTGYKEEDLVDYDISLLKSNSELVLDLDEIQLSYSFGYSYGKTLYTGDNRIMLDGLSLINHYVKANYGAFKLGGYYSKQYTGVSYDVGLLATNILRDAKADNLWFDHYRYGFFGNPIFNIPLGSRDHALAREFADSEFSGNREGISQRLEPGTSEFESAKDYYSSVAITEGGARIIDESSLFNVSMEYALDELFYFDEFSTLLNYRLYDPKTRGTVLPDTLGNNITYYELGLNGHLKKNFSNERIMLDYGFRFDKAERFDLVFNQKISVLIDLGDDKNLRLAFKSGARTPSVREQFSYQQYGDRVLLGGLKENIDRFSFGGNSYYGSYVQRFADNIESLINSEEQTYSYNQALIESKSILETGIVNNRDVNGLKKESVRTVELGYRMLMLGGSLYLDMNSYYNYYDNFIGFSEIILPSTSPAVDPLLAANQVSNIAESDIYNLYLNSSYSIQTYGMSISSEYISKEAFNLGLNLNYNDIIRNPNDPVSPGFNTPKFKWNLFYANRNLIDNVEFKFTIRGRTRFLWESNFISGENEDYRVADFQVSRNMPNLMAKLRIGCSNIGNRYYTDIYGGPQVGAIFYVGFNKSFF